MAFVHLLDTIIQTKKQNKQVIFKGVSLGNEVFKTIVAMAYEMGVADRIMTQVKQGLLEFSYERKYPPTFRDTQQVFDDITKVWKVAHTNKKYYEKQDDDDLQVLHRSEYSVTKIQSFTISWICFSLTSKFSSLFNGS